MKKFIPALAALALLLAASCSGALSGGKPKIGVAIYNFDDTFMSIVQRSIEANGKDKAELSIVDSMNSQSTQNEQIDAFLSRKMRAIIVNPVDRTSSGQIVDKARARNIPVVFCNREPLVEDMAKWEKVYYVGAQAEQSGTYQGEIAAEYWKAHPEADKNKDGRMQYVMLTGQPGHQDALLRTEYSIRALDSAGVAYEKLAEESAHWNRVEGQEKMAAFLSKFGDRIEMVFCNNDDMALGAIAALKVAGYFDGRKYMPVVGVDATVYALEALSEGTLLGTVLNDADAQGKASLDLAIALAKGEDVTKTGWEITDGKYVWIPYQKVTQDNYTQFQKQ